MLGDIYIYISNRLVRLLFVFFSLFFSYTPAIPSSNAVIRSHTCTHARPHARTPARATTLTRPDCGFKRDYHWGARGTRVRRGSAAIPPLPAGNLVGGAGARPQGFANEGQAFAGAGVWGDVGGGAGARW